MAQRQLNIQSDEAFSRASSLAERLGRTTTDVVVEALRRFEDDMAPRNEQGRTPEQQRRFDRIKALARETARHKLPGATSNHDDLYDENGLPK
ncbi:type II toxin-antitoxin system VapB family antitoxin [Enterovirga rhinocerotis]|uniref:Putative transcription factor n=1 Tax=Enterovirga rhinocerotis TaxID=1339210 RepID=A0A4R7C4H9_9HYPH|nr:type II toxin-antitoxin system VapB family antitoxin [Enterovirga rhinocerotis]TDR93404.1 putative transcription factor [Enterovirga rhinocerotis]